MVELGRAWPTGVPETFPWAQQSREVHREHRKAADFRRRADGIEQAAEHAIYSDDADAIERLRERVAELEAERERIKRYNATCRKGSPDPSILDERQRAELATVARVCAYQLGKNGAAPSYWLSNLGGNISRNRKRLARMLAA